MRTFVAKKNKIMLSKNKIKLIKSLERRKFRDEVGLFVAEGPKVVAELMSALHPVYIAALAEVADILGQEAIGQSSELDIVSPQELARASFLRAPQGVVALFPIPERQWTAPSHGLSLALDNIQDPGNLGTIIRAADWFGVENVVCSLGTADVYSPKAVQATMGALARVKVSYADLDAVLSAATGPVYGTFMDGTNLYNQPLGQDGFIVMGNEGQGISKHIEELVTHRLLIPSYPANRPTIESLNVAVATSIVLAEFRRREKQTDKGK